MRFTASSKPWKYALMKKMCTHKKGALNNPSLRYVHFAIRHILKSKGAGRHALPGKSSYLQRLGLLWVASEATYMYMYTLIVQAKCTCTYCQKFLKWGEGKSQSRSSGPLTHSPQYVLHHWGGGGKGHPEMKHGYAHVHCKYNTV